jgi:hypothetical protein
MSSPDDIAWERRCLACGGQIADVLWRLASVLCHDCRDEGRRPDPTLLRAWAEAQRAAARKRAQEIGGQLAGAPIRSTSARE